MVETSSSHPDEDLAARARERLWCGEVLVLMGAGFSYTEATQLFPREFGAFLRVISSDMVVEDETDDERMAREREDRWCRDTLALLQSGFSYTEATRNIGCIERDGFLSNVLAEERYGSEEWPWRSIPLYGPPRTAKARLGRLKPKSLKPTLKGVADPGLKPR